MRCPSLRSPWLAVLCAIALAAPQSAHAQEAVLAVAPAGWTWTTSARNGTSVAVLEGNPATPGAAFTMLFRMPHGTWLAPHTHSTELRLVVVAGTLLLGDGPSQIAENARRLPAGGFARVAAGAVHYEGAEGEVIMLVTGIGPLQTRFLDPPARDPEGGRRRGTPPNRDVSPDRPLCRRMASACRSSPS